MKEQGTDSTPNPLALQEAWQKHPRFKQRALGGRRALDGFHYQFAVSLDRFFEAVLDGEDDGANLAFEGLSDLSEHRGELTYLVQVKTTLRRESLLRALAEALAVDEFLEECFPVLREKFRFRVTARRLRGSVPTEPATLTAADLALDSRAASRWEVLRKRCLPIEVDSAPEVRLAIRLWNDVAHPVTLVDTCMGRLLNMLASGAAPAEITNALLALWEVERRETEAPLHLLGALDLETDASGGSQRRIVHGVRPSIADIRDGCFMERPERLAAVLSIIREHWAAELRDGRASIPVFWITGPSGAGKSVLLLQVARELLADGEVEAVNFIESYAHALPRALDSASGTSVPLIVAGDDLFSPENRDPTIWREIGERAANRTFRSRFALLTCGPREQLKAFRRECERHRVLEPVEIVADPLSLAEQIAYHAWYQHRTGGEVPIHKEVIFVAAAWIYELHREEKLTPEAFALRFDKRLNELGISTVGHAALALNLFGLVAPETLFMHHRTELSQLIREQIWRLAIPTSGGLSGRFFHPQISRLIYDVLVPPDETSRRADDIAYGFDAMLEEGESADAFLGWLGSRKIGRKRAASALMLDEAMRVEILKALWPCFCRRGPIPIVLPRLFRWHQAALGVGIDLRTLGIKARIQAWWHESDEDSLGWGLLFQMVWDAADPLERSTLLAAGRAWLQTHIIDGAWPWIYNRLMKLCQSELDFRALGLRWLDSNAANPGWPGVWGGLFETRKNPSVASDSEESELLRVALQAIPVQPESAADFPVWQRTLTLDPLILDFLNAVTRKLASVRNPHKMKYGVKFLLSFIAPGELISKLSPALQETLHGSGWPFLWQELALKRPREAGLSILGRDWLAGRENQPGWHLVAEAVRISN